MKKIWPSFVVLLALFPAVSEAADNTTVGVGTGAVAGALVGGPIGAVVGAVAGGVIGANSRSVRRVYRPRGRTAYRRRAGVRVAPQGAASFDRDADAGRGMPRTRAAVSEIAPVRHTEPASVAVTGWKDPR